MPGCIMDRWLTTAFLVGFLALYSAADSASPATKDTWSAWASCTVSCGGGIRIKSRPCVPGPGRACGSSHAVMVEACGLKPCGWSGKWSTHRTKHAVKLTDYDNYSQQEYEQQGGEIRSIDKKKYAENKLKSEKDKQRLARLLEKMTEKLHLKHKLQKMRTKRRRRSAIIVKTRTKEVGNKGDAPTRLTRNVRTVSNVKKQPGQKNRKHKKTDTQVKSGKVTKINKSHNKKKQKDGRLRRGRHRKPESKTGRNAGKNKRTQHIKTKAADGYASKTKHQHHSGQAVYGQESDGVAEYGKMMNLRVCLAELKTALKAQHSFLVQTTREISNDTNTDFVATTKASLPDMSTQSNQSDEPSTPTAATTDVPKHSRRPISNHVHGLKMPVVPRNVSKQEVQNILNKLDNISKHGKRQNKVLKGSYKNPSKKERHGHSIGSTNKNGQVKKATSNVGSKRNKLKIPNKLDNINKHGKRQNKVHKGGYKNHSKKAPHGHHITHSHHNIGSTNTNGKVKKTTSNVGPKRNKLKIPNKLENINKHGKRQNKVLKGGYKNHSKKAPHGHHITHSHNNIGSTNKNGKVKKATSNMGQKRNKLKIPYKLENINKYGKRQNKVHKGGYKNHSKKAPHGHHITHSHHNIGSTNKNDKVKKTTSNVGPKRNKLKIPNKLGNISKPGKRQNKVLKGGDKNHSKKARHGHHITHSHNNIGSTNKNGQVKKVTSDMGPKRNTLKLRENKTSRQGNTNGFPSRKRKGDSVSHDQDADTAPEEDTAPQIEGKASHAGENAPAGHRKKRSAQVVKSTHRHVEITALSNTHNGVDIDMSVQLNNTHFNATSIQIRVDKQAEPPGDEVSIKQTAPKTASSVQAESAHKNMKSHDEAVRPASGSAMTATDTAANQHPIQAASHAAAVADDIDGWWGTWEHWGTCSNSCGAGKQVRVRRCQGSRDGTSTRCRGADQEAKVCVGQSSQCSADALRRAEKEEKAAEQMMERKYLEKFNILGVVVLIVLAGGVIVTFWFFWKKSKHNRRQYIQMRFSDDSLNEKLRQ